MKNTKEASITLTPGILNLMRHVSADEVESVLKNAFPKYFIDRKSKTTSKKTSDDDLKLLEEIRTLAVSGDTVDSVKATREVREQFS